MADISDQVKKMYTDYPFPSKDREANELPGYFPEFVTRWFAKKSRHMAGVGDAVGQLLAGREGKQRVLDAGCGTGEILSHVARANPDADVHAVDLTPASLEKAKALIERESLSVTFHEHNLMEPLPYDDDQFDVVTSIGVLHCLPEPVQGFKNIARCLKPDGTLLCYLYGSLGRWDLTLKQDVVALLAKDEMDFDDKIRIVETLGLYPRRHDKPVKEFLYSMLGFDRTKTRRVWIVDQLCHVKELCYTAAEIEELIYGAGFDLVRFRGFPDDFLELLEDEDLAKRANALSKPEQWRLIECLTRPTGYLFEAKKRG